MCSANHTSLDWHNWCCWKVWIDFTARSNDGVHYNSCPWCMLTDMLFRQPQRTFYTAYFMLPTSPQAPSPTYYSSGRNCNIHERNMQSQLQNHPEGGCNGLAAFESHTYRRSKLHCYLVNLARLLSGVRVLSRYSIYYLGSAKSRCHGYGRMQNLYLVQNAFFWQ